MANRMLLRTAPPSSKGIALIVGLVILAVLSLIGVAVFSITTQEERMAGNSRDRIRAFEAAEAALRYCEAYVAGGAAAFDGSDGTYPALLSSAGAVGAAGTPITESSLAQNETFWQSSNNVRQLKDTNGNPYNGNSYPPACLAEKFSQPNSNWSGPGTPLNSANSATVAHVTAHGYGLNPNTVVRLESYYAL